MTTIEKALQLGFSLRPDLRKVYPNWKSWVADQTDYQVALILDNEEPTYRLLNSLPKDEKGDVPSTEDLVAKVRPQVSAGAS